MVKGVFKTLLKVPCYIVIGYLIMNIVLFLGYYIKALGLSYAVMQVAVENNYIPESEDKILTSTMTSIGSDSQSAAVEDEEKLNMSAVSNFGIYIDTDNSTESVEELYPDNPVFKPGSRITDTSVNNRKQYGNTITVGVGYVYTAVLPLPTSAEKETQKVYSDKINGGANVFEYKNSIVSTPVRITYRVPGLKYYPDLG